MEEILQILLSGLVLGLIFSLVAVGLNIIFGVMDIVNFAHGEFLMVSMYICYWLFVWFGLSPLFSLPICIAALFLLGVGVYKLLIGRILSAPMLTQIFATFGLMLFLQNLALFLWSSDYRTIQDPLIFGKKITVLDGVFLGVPQLAAGAGALVITGLVFLLINKTELGRALRATAEDKEAAALMGINTDRIFALSWGIGGACVGAAGALLAGFYPIFPYVGAVFCTTAFVVVVLGGFGSIAGAFFAGIIIGLVQIGFGSYFPAAYKMAFVYGIYLLTVFVRPRGLLGKS
ncbi:MAG: branched-chain amino acid ABC transporter permease [Desulfovibrio sp.]|nr:branched-chain amino acid ABC transporter permease [Desulfovibrio sp.]